ncbi:MAG: hypothetical protein ACLUD2_18405 [Clostridium sp.]
MVEELLEEGRIFAYFHQLGRHIPHAGFRDGPITIEYRWQQRDKAAAEDPGASGRGDEPQRTEFVKVYRAFTSISMYCLRERCWSMRSYENGTDGGKKTDEGRLSYDGSQTNSTAEPVCGAQRHEPLSCCKKTGRS